MHFSNDGDHMKNILRTLAAAGVFFASCAVSGMDNNHDNNRDNRGGNRQFVIELLSPTGIGAAVIDLPFDMAEAIFDMLGEEEEEEWEEMIDLQAAADSCNALIPQLTSSMLSSAARSAERDGETYKAAPWPAADIVNSFINELRSISDLSFRSEWCRRKVDLKFGQETIQIISPAIILPGNNDFEKTLRGLADKYNGFLPCDKVEGLLKGESMKDFLSSREAGPYVFPGFLCGEDWIGNEINTPLCLPGMLIKCGSQLPLQLVDKVISLKGMGNAGTYDELAEIAASFNGDLPVNMLLENAAAGGISRESWMDLLIENHVLLRNPYDIGPNFLIAESFNIHIKGRALILVVPDTIVLSEGSEVSRGLLSKLQAAERYENSIIPKVSVGSFIEMVLETLGERDHEASVDSLIQSAPDFLKTASLPDIVAGTRRVDVKPVLRGREHQFVQFGEYKFQLVNGVKFAPDAQYEGNNTYALFFPQLMDIMHRDLGNIINRFDVIFDGVKFDRHYRGIPCNMPMHLPRWQEWQCAAHKFAIVHPHLLPRCVVNLCDGTEVEIEPNK